MLKLIILFGILALTTAATIASNGRHYENDAEKEPIAIIKSESHRKSDGSFNFAYEASNGEFRQETGNVVNLGTDEQGVEVSGSYRYYDANGELVEVVYTAGKNGFIPIGSHIPIEISAAANAASKPEAI